VAAAFEAMKTAFNAIDTDKSGTIELSEVTVALASMGSTASEADIKSIFEAADEDHNSKLSFQEFVVFLCVGTLVKQLPQDGLPDLAGAFAVAVDAFDIFDVSNTGVIVLSEVRATLKDLGSPDTLVARMTELVSERSPVKHTPHCISGGAYQGNALGRTRTATATSSSPSSSWRSVTGLASTTRRTSKCC
jgi:Ca2+-binding EF-hand superfamily protein